MDQINHEDGFIFEEAGFRAQLCTTPETLEIAYRMRYKAYRVVDGIEPNEDEMAIDPYDYQSNARTHLLWYEGKPVASIRSLIWSDRYNWQGTTSMDVFRADVKKQLGLDKRLLESTRFVLDPDFKGRKTLTAQYLLFRVQTISCLYDQCQYVITSVRPKHIGFYKRLMDFKPISDPVQIEGFTFEALLMATPYSSRHVLAKNASIAKLQLDDYERYLVANASPILQHAAQW